jgi:hypothetical protein
LKNIQHLTNQRHQLYLAKTPYQHYFQFDVEGSRHTGNNAGMEFWPDKADGVDWLSVECSSTDNNTNWGANGLTPDGDVSFPTCYVNCACEGDIFGCTDEDACNYNAEAGFDDGSCTYIVAGDCDCDGNVLDDCGVTIEGCDDADADGICDDVDDCVGFLDCNGTCVDLSYQSWVDDGYCDATG